MMLRLRLLAVRRAALTAAMPQVSLHSRWYSSSRVLSAKAAAPSGGGGGGAKSAPVRKFKKLKIPRPPVPPDPEIAIAQRERREFKESSDRAFAAALAADPQPDAIPGPAHQPVQNRAVSFDWPKDNREPEVGERLPEPEVPRPHKIRGIDYRPVEWRLHSVVGNAPWWGGKGAYDKIVEHAEQAQRLAAEARGQVYNPPDESWREARAQRKIAQETKHKARLWVDENPKLQDRDQVKAFLKPLGLEEFEEKVHSLGHLFALKKLGLKRAGMSCQQRKLFLKHTEICRQRAARGLVLYYGAGTSAIPPPPPEPVIVYTAHLQAEAAKAAAEEAAKIAAEAAKAKAAPAAAAAAAPSA